MALIGGAMGYHLIRLADRKDRSRVGKNVDQSTPSKMRLVFGEDLLQRVKGASVLDYGCGSGFEVIEMAKAGASRVVGMDIRDQVMDAGRAIAARQGLDTCAFVTRTDETFDIVTSLDAFEHFAHPDKVLQHMSKLLRPGGELWACFGPTWLHPRGGHLFSVFPWSHLIISEESLLKWRSGFKSDGARSIEEVEGGLNRLTIGKFMKIVKASDLEVVRFACMPIRALRWLHGPLTREVTTASVACILRKPKHEQRSS